MRLLLRRFRRWLRGAGTPWYPVMNEKQMLLLFGSMKHREEMRLMTDD